MNYCITNSALFAQGNTMTKKNKDQKRTAWTLTITEGDVIDFPDDLIDRLGWKVNDVLFWNDNEDGTYTVAKHSPY